MSPRVRDWAGAGWITGFVLAVAGMPAPAGNEYVYMPLLKAVADPSYLANDWTFSQGFAEKAVFNLTFALPMRVLDLEATAWLGRIVFWLIMARLLVALGRRLGSPAWATALGVSVLVAVGWSMGVAAETFFGHFQASQVAWPLFLGSIVLALDGRYAWSAAAVGLTFSFHPSIGFWSGGSLLLALLLVESTRRPTLRALPWAALAAVPGLWFLIVGGGSPDLDPAAAEFIVLSRIPHHVDPAAFGERGPLLLAMMAVVNLGWTWTNRSALALRLLGLMQLAALLFFGFGVIARVVERYDLLLLQPFRLGATLIPLVFVLTMGAMAGRGKPGIADLSADWLGRAWLGLSLLAVLLLFVLWNPVVRAIDDVAENVSSWTSEPQPLDDLLTWAQLNTAEGLVMAAPPWRENIFSASGRAQLVSWEAVTYDRPGEWMDRLAVTVGDTSLYENVGANDQELLAEYESLGLNHWLEVRERYGITHVVTTAALEARVLNSVGDWHLYELASG